VGLDASFGALALLSRRCPPHARGAIFIFIAEALSVILPECARPARPPFRSLPFVARATRMLVHLPPPSEKLQGFFDALTTFLAPAVTLLATEGRMRRVDVEFARYEDFASLRFDQPPPEAEGEILNLLIAEAPAALNNPPPSVIVVDVDPTLAQPSFLSGSKGGGGLGAALRAESAVVAEDDVARAFVFAVRVLNLTMELFSADNPPAVTVAPLASLQRAMDAATARLISAAVDVPSQRRFVDGIVAASLRDDEFVVAVACGPNGCGLSTALALAREQLVAAAAERGGVSRQVHVLHVLRAAGHSLILILLHLIGRVRAVVEGGGVQFDFPPLAALTNAPLLAHALGETLRAASSRACGFTLLIDEADEGEVGSLISELLEVAREDSKEGGWLWRGGARVVVGAREEGEGLDGEETQVLWCDALSVDERNKLSRLFISRACAEEEFAALLRDVAPLIFTKSDGGLPLYLHIGISQVLHIMLLFIYFDVI
jgi:hypothetical protein